MKQLAFNTISMVILGLVIRGPAIIGSHFCHLSLTTVINIINKTTLLNLQIKIPVFSVINYSCNQIIKDSLHAWLHSSLKTNDINSYE